MQKKSFRQSLLDGFAAIGQGWFDIMDSFTSRRRQWRYEDHFGTDEEQIRKDRDAVRNDLWEAMIEIERQQRGIPKDEET